MRASRYQVPGRFAKTPWKKAALELALWHLATIPVGVILQALSGSVTQRGLHKAIRKHLYLVTGSIYVGKAAVQLILMGAMVQCDNGVLGRGASLGVWVTARGLRITQLLRRPKLKSACAVASKIQQEWERRMGAALANELPQFLKDNGIPPFVLQWATLLKSVVVRRLAFFEVCL